MLTRRAEETALVGLQIFATLSAILGGGALITGVISLPNAWLDGTIFSSYTVPGLILAIVVGGSQLVSFGLVYRRDDAYYFASALAGGILMGWIIGELIIVGSHDAVMFGYQLIYFVIGFLEFALASFLLRQREPNR